MSLRLFSVWKEYGKSLGKIEIQYFSFAESQLSSFGPCLMLYAYARLIYIDINRRQVSVLHDC